MSDTEVRSNQSIKTRKRGMIVLFMVLIVWGLLIAVGSFQTQASTDIRRPLIVIAIMAVFLGGWGFALWKKSSRKQSL